ncbi:procathepsin L-like [Helicoverpa zea]|uniref:procathepsin L-like n=1 Tax=Helicoverpa zea TaxID=7113 RepID=UPI001F580537|nr:procathepsin L-like [Helicoverpa zea]
MAAIPATLVLFLYITLASGYTLLREDDDNEIVWPSEYHFKGEKLNLKSSLKETFEVWYSAELNRSRVDFQNGNVKKYYYGDTGHAFVIHPITTEEVTNEEVCLMRPDVDEQIDFLPDVSELTYTGQTMTLYDKVVDVWSSTEEYEEKVLRETTLYVFKTDAGIDLPVQLVRKTYNYDLGEVSAHTISNFFDYTDEISEEELTVENEDDCEDPFADIPDYKTTMKFYHPDIPVELDAAFEMYTTHHGKHYQDNEHQIRKAIFEKNWRMVEEHNRKNLGFRVELNDFSDKTDEELKYLAGTFPSSRQDPDMLPFPHTLQEIDELAEELPENFDLRIEGAITPVKNQGHCGSCWAFCTTAAVEGAIARSNGDRLLDLSEQSLVDCAWGFDNLGCNGGTLDGAMKYVLTHGIPTEMEYGVYEANDGYCAIQNMTSPYKIRGFSQVTPRNPNALKLALVKYGPVTVGVHASFVMQHYSNGLFYDFSCEDSYANHGVTVVGYGVRNEEEYWIVKNSWGETWGEDGYILISAKNNNCGVLDSPFYPIV